MIGVRVERVLKLNRFEIATILEDKKSFKQAVQLVTFVAFMSALGVALASGSFVVTFLTTFIWGFLRWGLWSFLLSVLGVVVLSKVGNLRSMLRIVGFAQVPFALLFFRWIPYMGTIAAVIATIWTALVLFVAVRTVMNEAPAPTAGLLVAVGFIMLVAERLISWLISGWIVLFLR